MLDLDKLSQSAEEAAELLSAIANANRLMILCNLLNGEMAVLPLAEAVGMSQSALSQQLSKLRALKLVSTRRQGRTIYYSVASDKVSRVLALLYEIYCAPAKAQQESRQAVTA
ncbi:metalloregulator ArsR/SmtB family transcription factor [Mesorhizobium sp. Z1-4]|uniref:ArsR/SmtB family transcription factor n=1 Tax=Mesorhizobium sp. Z1-4 TaxID=2448478 RepID=UPI000FD9AFA5|nr:metalloregulator ArsR/SmtB family transcription factor [Mesorhizobium sp. Z1-4]